MHLYLYMYNIYRYASCTSGVSGIGSANNSRQYTFQIGVWFGGGVHFAAWPGTSSGSGSYIGLRV